MDSKKVLQKLLKIAENQQKMIMKLAQAQQGLPPDSLPNSQVSMTEGHGQPATTPPPPADLKPSAPSRTPSKALYDAIAADPKLKAAVQHVNPPSGNEMQVVFHKGSLNQANWDAVLKKYQDLLNKNVIFTNYKLTYSQM